MKRIALILVLFVTAIIAAMATDMSTIWSQIANNDSFIVADISKDKAAKNDFETLTVALNSAPTSQQINDVKRLISTVDENQKVTSVNHQGIEVSIYAAPANADATLYKVMLLIGKNDSADKFLAVLYGTCTQQNITNALQNLSIEDIIGG